MTNIRAVSPPPPRRPGPDPGPQRLRNRGQHPTSGGRASKLLRTLSPHHHAAPDLIRGLIQAQQREAPDLGRTRQQKFDALYPPTPPPELLLAPLAIAPSRREVGRGPAGSALASGQGKECVTLAPHWLAVHYRGVAVVLIMYVRSGTYAKCSIPDDHIDPRRSAFFMARSILRDIRSGVRAC